MPDGTTKVKNLPDNWGTDSHVTVYMDGFVYSISGYTVRENECHTPSTLEYGINVHVRSLIFGKFPHLYALISVCAFINFWNLSEIMIKQD